MHTLRLLHESDGSLIGNRILCADTPLLRLAGLLGTKELLEGEGVWLQPSSGVHTIGMRFAIDVLGLDEQLRVVKLWANLRPQRITSVDFRLKSVVELASGSIQAHGIMIGDRLKLLPNEPESPHRRYGRDILPAEWS